MPGAVRSRQTVDVIHRAAAGGLDGSGPVLTSRLKRAPARPVRGDEPRRADSRGSATRSVPAAAMRERSVSSSSRRSMAAVSRRHRRDRSRAGVSTTSGSAVADDDHRAAEAPSPRRRKTVALETRRMGRPTAPASGRSSAISEPSPSGGPRSPRSSQRILGERHPTSGSARSQDGNQHQPGRQSRWRPPPGERADQVGWFLKRRSVTAGMGGGINPGTGGEPEPFVSRARPQNAARWRAITRGQIELKRWSTWCRTYSGGHHDRRGASGRRHPRAEVGGMRAAEDLKCRRERRSWIVSALGRARNHREHVVRIRWIRWRSLQEASRAGRSSRDPHRARAPSMGATAVTARGRYETSIGRAKRRLQGDRDVDVVGRLVRERAEETDGVPLLARRPPHRQEPEQGLTPTPYGSAGGRPASSRRLGCFRVRSRDSAVRSA